MNIYSIARLFSLAGLTTMMFSAETIIVEGNSVKVNDATLILGNDFNSENSKIPGSQDTRHPLNSVWNNNTAGISLVSAKGSGKLTTVCIPLDQNYAPAHLKVKIDEVVVNGLRFIKNMNINEAKALGAIELFGVNSSAILSLNQPKTIVTLNFSRTGLNNIELTVK